jgi:hypothetical protein
MVHLAQILRLADEASQALSAPAPKLLHSSDHFEAADGAYHYFSARRVLVDGNRRWWSQVACWSVLRDPTWLPASPS